jgi:hypothetical protein
MNEFPHTVLMTGEIKVLQLDRLPSGNLMPILDVIGQDGTILARFDRDGYVLGSHLVIKRPDKSTLIVVDKYGEEAIDIQYLNPHAIKISGHLFDKGQEVPFGLPHMNEVCAEGKIQKPMSFWADHDLHLKLPCGNHLTHYRFVQRFPYAGGHKINLYEHHLTL